MNDKIICPVCGHVQLKVFANEYCLLASEEFVGVGCAEIIGLSQINLCIPAYSCKQCGVVFVNQEKDD